MFEPVPKPEGPLREMPKCPEVAIGCLRVKAFCDEEGRVYERVRRVSWWTGRVVEECWLLVGE